ncbi:MAG: hypothetical protein ONB30_05355 [candidate division KSB1 bacterium]|nr:hypothetical protein [candidate division KSB1 bacterium]
MPDLTTHLALTHLGSRPLRLGSARLPLYLGALLPDLLTRPFYILYPPAYFVVYSLHTPVATGLAALAVAQLFAPELRPQVRTGLLAGSAFHFALDVLQRQVGNAYYWLFPLSWKTFDLGLFWPEDSLRWLPVVGGAVVLVEGSALVYGRVHHSKGAPNASAQ